MLRLTKAEDDPARNWDLLLLSLYIGLATMSKVHGVFLWFGFGGYLLCHNRKLLGNPYLYVSMGLTLLIVSPIVFWNIDN